MDVSVAHRAVDRFAVTRHAWSLATEAGERIADQLRLNPDGRIACCGRADAYRWDVRSGRLVFLDRAERPTAWFDTHEPGLPHAAVGEARSAASASGRFAGTFVARPDERLALEPTARIEQPPAPSLRVSPRGTRRPATSRNLVVLRAGTSAPVPAWTHDMADEDRNWDLCISWAGDPDAGLDGGIAAFHAVQGGVGRWTAMHRLLHADSVLARYDQVMIPGGDVAGAWSAINIAFAEARDLDMMLSQPSFSNLGEVDRDADRHRDGSRLRLVETVSPRLPIFSARALSVCAPSFGLDLDDAALARLWTALLAAPENRIGVLDRSVVAGIPAAGPEDAAATAAPDGTPDATGARADLRARYGIA